MYSKYKIISCYSEVGKSYVGNLYPQFYTDCESSPFNYVDKSTNTEIHKGTDRVQNPNFLQEYLSYVDSVLKIGNVALISLHTEVVRELAKTHKILMVLPSKDNKAEYLERYKRRGNNPTFIKDLDECFVQYIDIALEAFENNENVTIVTLPKGKYLIDLLEGECDV